MSLSQVKNFQRRLEIMEKEASHELDRACENQLWRNLGFDAIDTLQNETKRAKANYYYGQWQTVKELRDILY